MSIIIFILILLVLVVSHEFGHYIVAKKSGIRVDEFSFGFPPKIFGKKIGETTYNFNLLPFGGYVKIFGENDTDLELNEEDKKRSFVHKPKHVQAFVLVAGILMNLLLAWFLLSVGYMSGLPSSISMAPKGVTVSNQYLTVTNVGPNTPAFNSGIKAGDKIIKLETLNDYSLVSTTKSVQSFIKEHSDEIIKISYIRAGEELSLEVTPIRKNIDTPATIGISMDVIGTLKLPVHKAMWEGLKLTSNLTIGTINGFYTLIKDAINGRGDMSAITGPIGIVGIVGDAASFGFIYLLSFTALISINLAVINLIPFPALDGGRLLFLLIEKIKGSKIKTEVANLVNLFGFGLLILLMVFITYHDIIKLI